MDGHLMEHREGLGLVELAALHHLLHITDQQILEPKQEPVTRVTHAGSWEASKSTGGMIFSLSLGRWQGSGRRKHIPVAEETAESREPQAELMGWKGIHGCPALLQTLWSFPSGSPSHLHALL